MKIGIFTQPLHNNYGGILQNYALQQILRLQGFEPETIDHGSRRLPAFIELIIILRQRVYHFFRPNKYESLKYQPNSKELAEISKHTRYFIDKYIVHTDPFTSNKELESLIAKGGYEGYVVGSDQCWRPTYSGGFLKEMFLGFTGYNTNVKRVAYAASFGAEKWEYTPEMTSECARLASRFDFISVREDSGVRLCRDYLGVNAAQVLDPTMLLGKEYYIKLVEQENEPVSPGDLFYYILDPSKKKMGFINRISKEYDLTPFTILPHYQAENRTKYNIKHQISECVYPTVTSWLRGFIDAKMVIVDSFHGAVFSIIFNKPFLVISNTERGNARFDSLLKTFGLEKCFINPVDLDDELPNLSINWGEVNNIKAMKIKESMKVFAYLRSDKQNLPIYD